MQHIKLYLLNRLTVRQLQIIRLFSEGFSTKEIASKIGIRPRSVNRQVSNIMDNVGLYGDNRKRNILVELFREAQKVYGDAKVLKKYDCKNGADVILCDPHAHWYKEEITFINCVVDENAECDECKQKTNRKDDACSLRTPTGQILSFQDEETAVDFAVDKSTLYDYHVLDIAGNVKMIAHGNIVYVPVDSDELFE